jgi:hypothetical protein
MGTRYVAPCECAFEVAFVLITKTICTICPRPFKRESFFNKDGYAKHLIGNAYSVVVVEMLIQPLTSLFATKEYEGYDYTHPWRT